MNYKLKIGDYVWFQFSDLRISPKDFLYATKQGKWTAQVEYKEELEGGDLIIKKFTMQSKLIKAMYAKKL